MEAMNLSICLLNVGLCIWQLYVSLKKRRLVTISWLLMLYFALCFIPVSLTEEISWIRGFYYEYKVAKTEDIRKTLVFLLIFNIIFFLSDALLCLFTPRPSGHFSWILPKQNSQIRLLLTFMSILWLIGSVWYFWHSRTQGYRDYVEGSDWSVVILWASSPAIVLAAMQKRFLLAIAFCTPFLYFALHLAVRSFALLSLIPLLTVCFYQVICDGRSRTKFRRILQISFVASILLISISIVIMRDKNGHVSLPDAGMPFGTVQAMTMADRLNERTSFNSLTLYGVHYINPFMRLFSIDLPNVEDTPVIIARLLDGVPEGWPIYFHYPALLWADAYLSFGWNGLWLAVFWALILFLWDTVMLRYPLMLAMLLPYFVWHCYMLIRGAVAVASTPVSYSLYISLIVFLAALRLNFFLRNPDFQPKSPRLSSPQDGMLPKNIGINP